jgi:hypothetical protein
MPRAARAHRLARISLILGLLLGAGVTEPSLAEARPLLTSAGIDEAAAESDGSGGYGPIVMGCLGVLFGGALALWQIRGMQRKG